LKKISLIFLFVFFFGIIYSQQFLRPQEWKKFRKEIYFSTGSTAFLGDLGGRDQTGTHFSPVDMDITQTRTAYGIGARYKVFKNLNFAGKVSYLLVKGDDAATKDIYRNERNLNFKSDIYELSGRVEIGLQKMKKGGGHYGVQKNSAQYKNIVHSLYGFIGFGVFYFDPMGKIQGSKNYVKLRKLNTEGQGLPGGPKKYSNISFSVPMGAFYKVTIKKKWSLGVELNYRQTFSDYIDDVGGTYYNKDVLRDTYGDLSAWMSDPNITSDPDRINAHAPSADGSPAMRGDKQKDVFVSLEVTLGYVFKKSKKSARLRSKF
jgi:hypothetical protein